MILPDHSNHEKCAEFIREARVEQDPVLRAMMVKAAKRYHGLDVAASKRRLKLATPGYGAKRLFFFVTALLIVVVAMILVASLFFRFWQVLLAVSVACAVIVVAGAFALRWTGAIGEESLLQMLKLALNQQRWVKGSGDEIPADTSPSLPGESPASPNILGHLEAKHRDD